MLSNFLKGFDFFGQNMAINFRKKSTHQTLCGGGISLLVRIVVLYYAAGKIIQCAGRSDPTITSTTKLFDRKGASVDLEGSGFELVVGFHDKKNFHKMKKLP